MPTLEIQDRPTFPRSPAPRSRVRDAAGGRGDSGQDAIADVVSPTPFPVKLLTSSMLLTILVVSAMVWSGYDLSRKSTTAQRDNLRLSELRGSIVHLDEVLTMSARMAVTTGDLHWERRYRQFEPVLDAAVKETMALTIRSSGRDAARQTDEANLRLVEMENQSFALVESGRIDEARRILFGEAYEAQKKIYATGMTTLVAEVQAKFVASERAMARRTFLFGVGGVISAAWLIFAWLRVWSRVQEWRGVLARTLVALGQARTGLERSVKERTAQLQTALDEHERTEHALRRSEANFRFLNELGEATRPLTDPAAIMAVTARLLGRRLQASRCAYADVENDSNRFTILHDYTDGCASTTGNYELSLFGPHAVQKLLGGQTLIIRNVDSELTAETGAEMFTAIGIKAIITCPLIKHGALRAMMAVHQSTPRNWDSTEIALVRDVTERCWATIERRRAEEGLRESEGLRRIAGRAAHVGGWAVDHPFARPTWSDEIRAIHEVPPDAAPDLQQALNFYTPEARPIITAAFRACIRQGTPFDLELEMFTSSGRKIWVHSIGEAQRDESGAIVRVQGACQDITSRKQAEQALAQAHEQLMAASRQAGIAEFATGILHNVGNVLNSVNTASNCVADSLKKSKAANLTKVVALLHEHEQDLGAFFTQDPKGKLVPVYLTKLAGQLAAEQAAALDELRLLQKHIEHIREIITTQQRLAKASNVVEITDVPALVADAVELNSSRSSSAVQIDNACAAMPPIQADKSRLLQILTNLIRNAQQACEASEQPSKCVRIHAINERCSVKISVVDNGVGIAAENISQLFAHGFTTKQDGHGFGLHSAALAVKAMSGSLTARSDGVGRGATFTLELPCAVRAK